MAYKIKQVMQKEMFFHSGIPGVGAIINVTDKPLYTLDGKKCYVSKNKKDSRVRAKTEVCGITLVLEDNSESPVQRCYSLSAKAILDLADKIRKLDNNKTIIDF